jgi:hypothetical protein
MVERVKGDTSMRDTCYVITKPSAALRKGEPG